MLSVNRSAARLERAAVYPHLLAAGPLLTLSGRYEQSGLLTFHGTIHNPGGPLIVRLSIELYVNWQLAYRRVQNSSFVAYSGNTGVTIGTKVPPDPAILPWETNYVGQMPLGEVTAVVRVLDAYTYEDLVVVPSQKVGTIVAQAPFSASVEIEAGYFVAGGPLPAVLLLWSYAPGGFAPLVTITGLINGAPEVGFPHPSFRLPGTDGGLLVEPGAYGFGTLPPYWNDYTLSYAITFLLGLNSVFGGTFYTDSVPVQGAHF